MMSFHQMHLVVLLIVCDSRFTKGTFGDQKCRDQTLGSRVYFVMLNVELCCRWTYGGQAFLTREQVFLALFLNDIPQATNRELGTSINVECSQLIFRVIPLWKNSIEGMSQIYTYIYISLLQSFFLQRTAAAAWEAIQVSFL